MEKFFLVTCLCTVIFSNAFAETKQLELPQKEEVWIADNEDIIVFNDVIYVPQRQSSFANTKFFVSLQTSLLSYDKYELTLDDYNIQSSTETFKFNNDIFDLRSFAFGLEIGDKFRIFLGASHSSESEESSGSDSEISISSY